MHFTRRHLDLQRSGAFVVVALVAVAGTMAASCSSEAEPDAELESFDASTEAAASDSGDAAPPPRDAARVDAAPLPVVCASASCATALVTTFDESFCALLSDRTVACWGQNDDGQLGRGEDAGTRDSAKAARVVGLSRIVALAHTCAVDEDGATWCWGKGPYLRDEHVAATTERTPVKLPIPPVTKVGVTTTTACAEVAGSVLCWGANVHGQVAVPEAGVDPNGAFPPRAIAVPTGAPIRDVVVGNASFVVRDDGSALSWGANPPLARVSSLFPDPNPAPIALEAITAMDVAGDNACAIAGGVAHCWGGPIHPGVDSPLARAVPERITTPLPVAQIATATSDEAHPPRGCACDVAGTVHCWGNNADGQAGDGTKSFAVAPVAVVSLPEPAAQVRTTRRATCALLTSGKIRCWGDDTNGQLANGRFATPSLVPLEVVLP